MTTVPIAEPGTAPDSAPGAYDDLLPLADARMADLFADGGDYGWTTGTVLDTLLPRLFDPRERDLLTVSAFSSAL